MQAYCNRFVKFAFVIFFSFLFTSCIDYVQSISYKDGHYHIYYKITLSKLLFALQNEDPEAIFESFEENALDSLPEYARANKVNTDWEVGLEFLLTIHPKTSHTDEKLLLPKTTGNKYYIPFFLGKEGILGDVTSTNDDEEQELLEAILSSAKCRIMISKKIIPDIESAYLEGIGVQNYSIPVFDYGDAFCMEIPFIVLFERGMYRFDNLIVIKKF